MTAKFNWQLTAGKKRARRWSLALSCGVGGGERRGAQKLKQLPQVGVTRGLAAFINQPLVYSTSTISILYYKRNHALQV